MLLGVSFGAVCALSATALERDVTLRFLPSSSSYVTGYLVYATDEVTQIEHAFDVGMVEPGSDGTARAVVVLDAEASFLVAMTAYNAEGESERSNQIQISAETTVCDPALCDDDRTCTVDFCDATGCLHTPLPDGTPCSDGLDTTTGDVCLAGVCQNTGGRSFLSVDAVSPRVVSPGRHTLMIQGLGFEPGATLRFENGKGRAPHVRSLLVRDGQTLEADVEVSSAGPKRPRFWDVVVNLPDQPEARLLQGVRIDP